MTTPLDDDALLAALGDALTPERTEPGAEAMAALHQALAVRLEGAEEDDRDPAVVVPFAVPTRRGGWARMHRLRHPVAAAVAVGVLATSGVAAAGVATDHLPGPTRNVAFALGFPVTSPALEAAQGTLDQLRQALAAHDLALVTTSTAQLRAQLAGLSTADRAQIDVAATDALRQADAFAESVAAGSATGGTTPAGGTTPDNGSSGGSPEGGTTSSDGGTTSGAGESPGGTKSTTPGTTEGDPGGTSTGSGSPSTTDGPAQSTSGTKPPGTTTTEPGDNSKEDGTDNTVARVTLPPTTTTTTTTTAVP